jgi:hypothetical protein
VPDKSGHACGSKPFIAKTLGRNKRCALSSMPTVGKEPGFGRTANPSRNARLPTPHMVVIKPDKVTPVAKFWRTLRGHV